MKQRYSLVHLTNISCPPPEMIHVAAKAGFDAVSLRTIPMGLPGENLMTLPKIRSYCVKPAEPARRPEWNCTTQKTPALHRE